MLCACVGLEHIEKISLKPTLRSSPPLLTVYHSRILELQGLAERMSQAMDLWHDIPIRLPLRLA